MPTVKSCLNKMLKTIDLFPNNQFLRYNGESDYTSATGGFVSFGLIIILIIIFANMGIRTINKKIISSSTSTKHDSNPLPLTFKMAP